jgi:hypothetical protein
MPNILDSHNLFVVIDGVEDPVLPDPQAPQIGGSNQLQTAMRTGLIRKASDALPDPPPYRPAQAIQVPFCRTADHDSVGHPASRPSRYSSNDRYT